MTEPSQERPKEPTGGADESRMPVAAAADTPSSGGVASRTWIVRVGVFALVVALAGMVLDQRYGHRDRIIASERAVDSPIAQVDGFNRPDSDQLAPPVASMWLQPEGEHFRILAGAAVAKDSVTGDVRAVATTSLPNQEDASQFPIGAFGLTIRNANRDSGMVVRYQDPTHYWLISPDPKRGVWVVSKIDGDTRTEMMSTQGILGVKDVTLWVEFRGDAIIVRSQGSLQATVTDPTYASSPSVGFLATGPDANKIQFDNAVIAFPPPS